MIRPAKQTDLISIYKLIQTAARKHRVLPRSKKELSDVLEYFNVYEYGREIVACCALEIYNKKIAEIRSLVVADGFQKQGIGRELVEICLKKAKKAGLREVLSITDKVNFFRKCGFDTCLNDQYAMFVRL